MKKYFLSVVFIFFILIFASACRQKSNQDLKIAVYLGGYGEVWINKLVERFIEKNPGLKIKIEANPDLAQDIPNRLENGSDDDIFFSHGISWEKLAVTKLIEPLNDIYEQEVENGIKLKDKIDENLIKTANFRGKYYKLPWTNGVGGIIYNKKMFEKNNWQVPKTYEQLVDLCKTIYDAKIPVDPTDLKPSAKKIKPFVWSKETYYWDYLVFDWWAQLEGVDFFEKYVKLESPEVFDPEKYPGQMKALEAWRNLVAKNPLHSMEDSPGKQYMAAQMDFINGYAAMIPNAQWLESEMINNIDPEKVEMDIMPAPFLKDAKKDSDGNYIRVNYSVGAGDSIIIPAKSRNKELAKKFLLFLAKDENMKLFTEKTNGVLLGFKYDNVNFDDSNLSKFAKSVIEINKESKKFNLYSNSLLVLNGKLSIEWTPSNLQPYSEIYHHYNNSEYLKDPIGWSAIHEFKILEMFKDKHKHIKDNWENWLADIN